MLQLQISKNFASVKIIENFIVWYVILQIFD